MKTLLTLILAFTITLASSQTDKAGEELIKFQKTFYIGMVLGTVISPILIIIGQVIAPDLIYILMGGTFGLVGIILMIESFSHIGKAGKYLKKIHEIKTE